MSDKLTMSELIERGAAGEVRSRLVANPGDIIVIIDGKAHVHPHPRRTSTNGAHPPANRELNGPMLNKLDAISKLPEVIKLCKALHGMVAGNPDLKASHYLRMIREQHPELKVKDGVDGRQAICRALNKLRRIDALENTGGKQPMWRVT